MFVENFDAENQFREFEDSGKTLINLRSVKELNYIKHYGTQLE
jgi:hypothetical protein